MSIHILCSLYTYTLKCATYFLNESSKFTKIYPKKKESKNISLSSSVSEVLICKRTSDHLENKQTDHNQFRSSDSYQKP